MIVATVKIDRAALDRLIREHPQKAGQRVRAMALDGDRYVKNSMGTSPSAAGDPPGVDTGALKNSIHVERRGVMNQAIVTGVDYDAHLEFGTVKMGARPYMGPMAFWLQQNVEEYWKDFPL